MIEIKDVKRGSATFAPNDEIEVNFEIRRDDVRGEDVFHAIWGAGLKDIFSAHSFWVEKNKEFVLIIQHLFKRKLKKGEYSFSYIYPTDSPITILPSEAARMSKFMGKSWMPPEMWEV